jgi:hypothetical protein
MFAALTRRGAISALATAFVARPAAAAAPVLELWKGRGCGCCSAWARHLERDGFVVGAVHELDDVDTARIAAGVPTDLAGCHTARVEGYVVEGHVPAVAVRRLLAERPAVVGIAVPGMPTGSPGMEIAGVPADPYDVVAFGADGSRSVFMAVRP